MTIYDDIDISKFWCGNDYAHEKYIGEPLTDELLASIEAELGYKLPAYYVELMRVQNGGLLAENTYPENMPDIMVEAIYGINRSKDRSLGGIVKTTRAFSGRNPKTGETIFVEAKTFRTGSKFWINEWGYPPLGVYFADTISGGHEMFCLDYSSCGPVGEPQVVHVHQESEYDVTPVAATFKDFVRSLRRRAAVFESGQNSP